MSVVHLRDSASDAHRAVGLVGGPSRLLLRRARTV
ncbi:hypothetical protein JOJ86_006640 [Rhodococcus percolatus]|nr:hypothetical protein [Rhodococcus opacus]MBP2208914.1 hypothetical protein [Rhodococcus opacus]CAG7584061.1 hypothetical protein E143388_01503 [Rhodococcus opacus]